MMESDKIVTVDEAPKAEDFGNTKNKAKRRAVWGIVIGAVILVAAITTISLIIHTVKENEKLDTESVTLRENLVMELGETKKVSDFLENLNGTLVEDLEIQPEELGETEVNFEYINIKKRKRPAKFTVKVVDTTAPRIYGSYNYTLNVGHEGDLTDLMMSGDNVDDKPKREVIGNYDLNAEGEYKLEYVITDASGNQSVHPFTLNIVKPSGVSKPPAETEKLEIAEVIKKYKTKNTKIGIDVSQWQGEIDWQKVKDAGVEFAFIRVGYQKGFGGEYILDPYFQDNMLEASELGLKTGVYFYSYADSVDEAVRQAEWVKQQIKGYEVQLGVAFDWESWSDFNQAGMSFRTINKVAKAFLNKINEGEHHRSEEMKEEPGFKGLLYGSKVYLDRIWEVPEYETWLAQYYDHATYEGSYRYWQMSNTGRVDGIYGDVDIDIMYLEEE